MFSIEVYAIDRLLKRVGCIGPGLCTIINMYNYWGFTVELPVNTSYGSRALNRCDGYVVFSSSAGDTASTCSQMMRSENQISLHSYAGLIFYSLHDRFQRKSSVVYRPNRGREILPSQSLRFPKIRNILGVMVISHNTPLHGRGEYATLQN